MAELPAAQQTDLYNRGEELGLSADFWPIPGREDVIVVVDNRYGPTAYVVPVAALVQVLAAASDGAPAEEIWPAITALQGKVTITATV